MTNRNIPSSITTSHQDEDVIQGLVTAEAKRCGKCEQHKPEQEFYDLASWCKECMKEYARRRRWELRRNGRNQHRRA
jgi:hypothetical protein